MNSQNILALSTLLLLSLFLQAASAELKLPAKARPTKTSSAEQLGSHDNNLGLKAGETVPEFKTNTYEGKSISFSSLLKNAPLLVIFYRGGWCPYCNYQVRQVTQAYEKFQQRQVTPVLISVDKTEGAALVKQSYAIPFPVLSDPQLHAHEAFNTVIKLDKAGYEKYKSHGMDLETWSGQTHHKMTAPAVFLVTKDGKVVWSHVALDFKTRPSVEQLLGVIDTKLL